MSPPYAPPPPPPGPQEPSGPLGASERKLLAFLARLEKLEPAAVRDLESGSGSLIERLHAAGVLSEERVARALSTGLRVPLLAVESVALDERVAGLLDPDTAKRFSVMPIRVEDGALSIVMANPLDHEAVRRVEFASGLRARISVAPRSEIVRAISERYQRDKELTSMLAGLEPARNLEVVSGETSENGVDVDSLVRETETAPVVKMVKLVLEEALRTRASDVHVEPTSTRVDVRFRVNGVLEQALEIPKWLQSPVVARLKVMANLDIAEHRVPQDGRLALRHQGRLVDMRVSSLPTTEGETVVLRILDSTHSPQDLDGVGLEGRDLTVLRRAVRKPQGMVLVTGPTGSGKTTTLYAALREIVSPERKIITIENPVEYKLAGVSQVNVNERQGLTFGGVLRSVLRQDPDVILVGEIRDRETAEVAFRAAQTGHLVLSTLHTNDTAATITRLLDLGIEPFVITASLIAVVAQRLVRAVCDRCAKAVSLDEDGTRALGLSDRASLREGTGCAACRGTGLTSRIGCYEVLEVTHEIRDAIGARASEREIRSTAVKQGMRTILRDALLKVESGKTTAAEVRRVIDVDVVGRCCPQCAHRIESAVTECPACGAALGLECPDCGKMRDAAAKRCSFCHRGDRASPHPARRSDRARVLVVDDHSDIRMLVRRILHRGDMPLEIEEAASGAQALAKVAEWRPNLVILDLMMPEMNGIEVCRRLRADLGTALIPVLMLTAMSDTESRSSAYLAGTDDYVTKPFQPEELLTPVRWLLGSRTPRRSSARERLRCAGGKEPVSLAG